MTGRPRKPQVPEGKKTTEVRTTTDWQDGIGQSKWGVLHGDRPKYQREPSKRPEPTPFGLPTISEG